MPLTRSLGKPPGSLVTLTYDSPVTVEPGDYIRTRTGRTYRVETEREVRSAIHPHRQRLLATVMEPDHVTEDDVTVHDMVWYSR